MDWALVGLYLPPWVEILPSATSNVEEINAADGMERHLNVFWDGCCDLDSSSRIDSCFEVLGRFCITRAMEENRKLKRKPDSKREHL